MVLNNVTKFHMIKTIQLREHPSLVLHTDERTKLHLMPEPLAWGGGGIKMKSNHSKSSDFMIESIYRWCV